jgi:Terminase large subunit, T4likevirus-type, N-terminal
MLKQFKRADDLLRLGLNELNNSILKHPNDLDIFLGKPFWCGNNIASDKDGYGCCFNHLIGLPEKNNKTYPIFDYELEVVNAIEQNRNIWIKKASGIGATELLLRYLTWKILVNNNLEYKNIFIISGTYVHHANEVKLRMENLFRNKFPQMRLESRFTDLWIKNTNIKIFPSRNVKDLRGYTEVSYLFIDEADYFEPSVNSELLHAITRYEEKSNCTTIMISTPNRPGGLFESIEKDVNSKYKKIVLLYDVGLGKIYDPIEIEKKKLEPEFEREYAGHYLGKIGNLFTPRQIENSIKLGEQYDTDKIPVSLYTLKSVGIDPGFSSSSTGIVVLEHVKPGDNNDKDFIRVVDSHLIDKGDPNKIVELCWSLWKQYGYMNLFFFIDGSNRGVVNLLKIGWQESLNWEKTTDFGSNSNIKIRPVNFSTEHKNMLSNLHAVITKQYLAIPPRYDKIITSLRTAYANELSLDKEQTSYDDLLDALRLGLKAYNFK